MSAVYHRNTLPLFSLIGLARPSQITIKSQISPSCSSHSMKCKDHTVPYQGLGRHKGLMPHRIDKKLLKLHGYLQQARHENIYAMSVFNILIICNSPFGVNLGTSRIPFNCYMYVQVHGVTQ